MSFSNDKTTWTTVNYATSYAWTLSSGDGQRTVYVKYTDSTGDKTPDGYEIKASIWVLPSAPTGLSSSYAGGMITLNWTDNSTSTATVYDVWRWDDKSGLSTYTKQTTVSKKAGNPQMFIDSTGIKSKTNYSYIVYARNGGGQSLVSNRTYITTP